MHSAFPDPVHGYRDAAMAAHGRIAQLERALADRSGPPRARQRVSALRLALLAAIAIPASLAGVCAGGVGVFDESRYRPLVIDRPSPRPPVIPPVTSLGWYEPDPLVNAHPGPALGMVSGEEVLVGLMWRRGSREVGLHAAAFDRATLKPRWIAGPFPSTWIAAPDRHTRNRYQLVVQGDAVVIVDSEGTARVLELASGTERDEIPIRRGTEGVCVDARSRLVLGAHVSPNNVPSMFPWELAATQPYVLDLATRKVTKEKHNQLCTPAPFCPDSGPRRPICEQLGAVDALPPGGDSRFEPAGIWQIEERRIAFGRGADRHPIAIGWGADGAAPWTASLEAHMHPATPRWDRAIAVSSRTFFHGYATSGGEYRIVALDVESGALRFSVVLPGPEHGARVDAMTVAGDDLFVAANDELWVLDGRSGKLRGRLEGP